MSAIVKDTADIRAKMLEIWALVEQKKMTASEARMHMGLARVILETLKVEIAAAHLASAKIPPVTLGREPTRLTKQ